MHTKYCERAVYLPCTGDTQLFPASYCVEITVQELVGHYLNFIIRALVFCLEVITDNNTQNELKSCSLDTPVLMRYVQLQTSRQIRGFRWKYIKWKGNRLHIKKEDIHLIVQELDPRGVELRRPRHFHCHANFAKVANYIRHLDSMTN